LDLEFPIDRFAVDNAKDFNYDNLKVITQGEE
jgi:hypothetical protein